MIKLSTRHLLVLAGLNWFLIGLALFIFGFYLLYSSLTEPYFPEQPFSLLAYLTPKLGSKHNSCIVMIVFALIIGHFKGKYVLKKTALKQIHRMLMLPSPHTLRHLYTKKYLLLILGMMSLGMMIRVLPIYADVRGFIDIAIGSALIHGAIHYLRYEQPLTESS